MSEESTDDAKGLRGWKLWAAIGGVVVVAALIVWAVIAASATGGSDAEPTPSRSDSSASATPSPSPTPSASGEAAEPSAPADPDARPTQEPVALDETARADDLAVELVRIEAVEGESTIAGEVAGPALRVTVRIDNEASTSLETPAVVVNLYYGPEREPAGGLLQPGSDPFGPTIGAGESGTGVYVFSVPEDERDDLMIEVDTVVGKPVVLFEGAFG